MVDSLKTMIETSISALVSTKTELLLTSLVYNVHRISKICLLFIDYISARRPECPQRQNFHG